MWKVGAESCPDGVPSREGGDTPRVTREMVTGRIGSSPSFHGDNLVVQYCALCGAAINALGPEGSAIAAIEDYTEVHRAWHDRLQRLLEGKG